MGVVNRTHGKAVMEQRLKKGIKKFVQNDTKKALLLKTSEGYVVLVKDDYDKTKLDLVELGHIPDAESLIGDFK